MRAFLLGFNYGVFFYFAIINAVYLGLVLIGYFGIRRQNRSAYLLNPEQMLQSPLLRPVSIIAPAYNEEATIVASVASLQQLQYPQFEVVLVNDGSKDNTLQTIIEHYDMVPSPVVFRQQLACTPIRGIYISSKFPRLIVVDKENAGKADSLNAGINVSRYPLICNVDSDSLLDKDALLKVARPFFEDPTTLAVGGTIRPANNCVIEAGEVVEVRMPTSWVASFQALEYLRAFLFGRVGWDELGATVIISGAFGMFLKSAVIAAGGYDTSTVGEDMELVVRLRKWGYQNMERHRVSVVADTVCWTEVPESLKILKRQRSRWQRGLMQTLRRHVGMIFNPAYGSVGLLALPFFLLFEMLGPIVETVGYIVFVLCWWLGYVNWEFAFWFVLVSLFLGTVLSLAAAVLMEASNRRYTRWSDVARLVWFAALENFGYRQLHNIFRLIGIFQYFKGKEGWGEMTRKGFRATTPAPRGK
ncbi:MAG: glycosyltransferase family 2 protein [Candidatus Sumerlaeaceae bacterium]